MLVRCLYASRATTSDIAHDINVILDQARRNNSRLGITGMLCVSRDIFIQVLEGGRDEVCELFTTIVRDARHANVRILMFEEIGERRFANWSMGQVDIAKVNPSLLLKYSDRATLDPFRCSGRATMAMLEEMVATASITSR
ncbi:MAG: BLUF domain-containing protein [Kofleriaceae bacterium]|nr:BLUF domain-containing protein [Kofleriaceae bacterium]